MSIIFISNDTFSFYITIFKYIHSTFFKIAINHSKVIIVDGSVASVGTANMDLRSFEQNFEVSLIIYDREVVKKLAVDFMKDLKVSTEGAIQRWKFRTKREKVCESVARLFAPVL